jgi:hypothetical protein
MEVSSQLRASATLPQKKSLEAGCPLSAGLDNFEKRKTFPLPEFETRLA